MISSNISNRLVFILSLLGLFVTAFLLYEYSLSGPMICPVGSGCDIVRSSPYSSFLGISIPVLGVIFYLAMAVLAVAHTHNSSKAKISSSAYNLPVKLVKKLQLLIALSGVGFGVYLTYLEAFVIKAFCFWCVLSFIISLGILLVIFARKKDND